MLCRRFVASTAQTVEAVQPLQQVGGLQVGVPVVGVGDLGAAAEQGVRLVEKSTAWVRSATSKTAARFFSVSPIHFETTLATSTVSRSVPTRLATTSAARDLPVPGGPQKSRRTPRSARAA